MKLVMDENLIAKNKKFENLSKRKLRICKIQIQVEKVWYLKENIFFFNFFQFSFKRRDPLESELNSFFFNFSNFSISFLKSAWMGCKKIFDMKSELIWSIHRKVTRDQLWCGQNLPIPAWNRVKFTIKLYKKYFAKEVLKISKRYELFPIILHSKLRSTYPMPKIQKNYPRQDIMS